MATITTNAHPGSRAFAAIGELGLIAASLAAFAGSVYLTIRGEELALNFLTMGLWAAGVFLALPVVRDPEGVLARIFALAAFLMGIGSMMIGGFMLLFWVIIVAMGASRGEFSLLHFLAMPVFFGLPILFVQSDD